MTIRITRTTTSATRRRAAAACGLAAALSLAACSSGEDKDSASATSSESSAAATTTVSETTTPADTQTAAAGEGLEQRLVGAEQAPAGMELDDFYGVFGSTGLDEQPQVEPANCAPYAFDSKTMVAWGSIPKDQAAVALYSGLGEEVVLVRIDAAGAPADPTGCEHFTKTVDSALGTVVSDYEGAVSTPAIAGLQDATAVKQTINDLTLDGNSMGGGKVGESATVITGMVGSTGVTVVGTGGVSDEDLIGLAEAQAQLLG